MTPAVSALHAVAIICTAGLLIGALMLIAHDVASNARRIADALVGARHD